jgi:hypothetical protein
METPLGWHHNGVVTINYLTKIVFLHRNKQQQLIY